MSRLEAKDIEVFYGPVQVLSGAGFSLKEGEIVGLIGPNGAGKSTLLKSAAGLIRPARGTVTLEGRPLHSLSGEARARSVGYLPQERLVHWPLDAERIVGLGRLPHTRFRSPKDFEAVQDAMKSTGTLHLAKRRFDQLSGGEKALVLIARVLAGKPSVLLADEPAAGLDPNHELEIFGILRSLAREGTSILVVLHNLTAASRFCDRLILIGGGAVRASGVPGKVLTPENLERVYGIRADFIEKDGCRYILPKERI